MKKTRLDQVNSRAGLKLRRDPYWHRLSEGRYVGFRRMTTAAPGNWLARYYDGAKNQQHPLGSFDHLDAGGRFDAAKKAAEEWFKHMGAGGVAAPGTVGDACNEYVALLRQERGDGPANDAEGRFRRLIHGHDIAKVVLSKLTTRQVAAWKAWALEQGGTKASFNRNATALRAALNLAKKRKEVASDQAWADELTPFENAGRPRTLYLNLKKRRALIEAASEESRAFFTGLALVPFRPGELASLKVEHFEADTGLLNVPKGKTESRQIPLGEDAVKHFQACAKGKLPSAWLVARADGSQWKKEQWRDEIKLAAAAAKLPAATVALTLRHSVITDLVMLPLDLFTVSKLAGTSVEMIEKTYGKLQHDHARAALQGLSLAPRAAA